METSKSIYPNTPRKNDFSSMYCEMAMQNYVSANECFLKIKENNYNLNFYPVMYEMYKSCISTVVFSAMSLEAFFNDYAASCLGDNDFYDNFDSLSLISKFQLISKFILKTPVDKSESYYSYLVLLNRLRNDFVHNKSVTPEYKGNTKEEIEAFEQLFGSEIIDIEEPPLNKKEIKDDFSNAQNAIKAIREVAYFFDRNDDSVNAVNKLFHIYTADFDPDWIPKYVKKVIKDFNIKAVK